MTHELPAQDPVGDPASSDPNANDAALLEEALRDALLAHDAGLLAAPFGVDAVALARARRRALRSDIRRLLAERQRGWQHLDDI